MLDYFIGFKAVSRDFTVHEYGEEQCVKGYTFGPYVRHTYFLHYVYSGKGTFEAEGKKYYLKKGQMFLICPGQVTIYKADDEDPWFYRWIAFDGPASTSLLDSAKLSRKNPIFTDGSDKAAGEVLKTMVMGGHMSFYKTMSLFWLLADAMCKEVKEAVSSYEYVDRVKSHIHSHYMENVSVKDMALAVGIDRSYLSRLFKEREGVSPQKYLIKYRIGMAKSLLQTTSLPISDISRMVGYPDPMDFSKIFKAYEGMSPAKWRKILPFK